MKRLKPIKCHLLVRRKRLSRTHQSLLTFCLLSITPTVLTDIQMPEMTGIELCDAIGKFDKVSVKPVVVGLTAGTCEVMDKKCLSSGMPYILRKPITLAQIKRFFDEKFDDLLNSKRGNQRSMGSSDEEEKQS